MNIERLTKLAEHLEALPYMSNPVLGFNMLTFLSYDGLPDQSGHHCQTTGCIAGHAIALFDDLNFHTTTFDIELTAQNILELSHLETNNLFYPNYQQFYNKIKPTAAAKAIYRLIAGDDPWPLEPSK